MSGNGSWVESRLDRHEDKLDLHEVRINKLEHRMVIAILLGTFFGSGAGEFLSTWLTF
jgi:hypothetical protein